MSKGNCRHLPCSGSATNCGYRVIPCTGYRERTRTVVSQGEDASLPCPHLHEYQSCEYSLCYRWKTTPSSPCRLKYPDMQCGEGMRNRTVECVSVLGVRLFIFIIIDHWILLVCNVRVPYRSDWNFRQYFYTTWYLGHLRHFDKNFTEIVPGEPLRRGS